MNARILGLQDNLDEHAARFEQHPLKHTLFLNSVPKAGTHLLRNIVRMFVPRNQQYHAAFIQMPNLRACMTAFRPQHRQVSWGHLLFCDESALALHDARHIVLIRDPYDWVLARARFYLSDEFQGPMNHIKHGAASAEEVMNLMILGVPGRAPSLLELFTFNAAGWTGTRARLLRYEDLVRHVKALDTPEAEAFFLRLLDDCGIDPIPDDWRERIRVGADRRHSRTARENLTGGGDILLPDVLPEPQRRLVDLAAPGLRELLGYA